MKQQKNRCARSRSKDNPYEVWKGQRGFVGWTWLVLKKWQVNDDKPQARWFCFVTSPMCPDGEYGDVYVKDIKSSAVKVPTTPDQAIADVKEHLMEQLSPKQPTPPKFDIATHPLRRVLDMVLAVRAGVLTAADNPMVKVTTEESSEALNTLLSLTIVLLRPVGPTGALAFARTLGLYLTEVFYPEQLGTGEEKGGHA